VKDDVTADAQVEKSTASDDAGKCTLVILRVSGSMCIRYSSSQLADSSHKKPHPPPTRQLQTVPQHPRRLPTVSASQSLAFQNIRRRHLQRRERSQLSFA